MIVAETHDDQPRHVSVLLIVGELGQENLRAMDIGMVQIEAAEACIGDLGEHRVAYAVDLHGLQAGVGLVVDHVAEVAQRDTGGRGVGPQVAGGRQ